MLLKDLNTIDIPEKKQTILEKRGLYNTLDVCYLPPRRYYHFEKKNELTEEQAGKFSRIEGKMIKISCIEGNTGRSLTKIQIATKDNPERKDILYVTFHGKQMYTIHKKNLNQHAIVCGNLAYAYGCFCMMDPIRFATGAVDFSNTWEVVYPKYKSISADWMGNLQTESLSLEELKDTLPGFVRAVYGLPSRKDALFYRKDPKSASIAKAGIKYEVIEDLMYYACVSENMRRRSSTKSNFVIKSTEKMHQMQNAFPYTLTTDQQYVLKKIKEKISSGLRANELVQGDVGCGKSIVAFLLMTLIAENSYQTVLMAPTTILATQHFKEYSSYAEKVGIRTAFLGGSQTAKERKEILSGIKDGEYDVIIGTHAVISDSVEYKNLAMVVIDEEHRFGVAQREALITKAQNGVHTILFSATPIPRTMANTIYGDKGVFEIKTMPPGRKPIQTAIAKGETVIYKFLQKKINEGFQAYVVCPLIDAGEEETNLKSVKETAKQYEKALNIPVGIVTGTQSKAETDRILSAFASGEIKLLVSTTVIEVGVNIPNATVMVIEDAFMFGLSQLHQLRGRVGRGTAQGYCILHTSRDAERLQVLCETTDGFKIAEEDYRLRGAGDLIGTEQSGNNHYFQLVLNYPQYYKYARGFAAKMVDNGDDKYLISQVEEKSEKIHIQPQKIRFFET